MSKNLKQQQLQRIIQACRDKAVSQLFQDDKNLIRQINSIPFEKVLAVYDRLLEENGYTVQKKRKKNP